MFCPKCNAHISDKSINCNNCGATIEEYKPKLESFSSTKNFESQNIKNQKINNKSITKEVNDEKITINNTIKSNEEYLNAYLNDKKESIENQFISAPALLFGPFYYFYKKIWTYGFIILIAYIVTDLIPNTNISIIIKLLINISLAFLFKKHYMRYADNEVQKIERFYDNKEASEIKKICKQKGKNIDIKIAMLLFVIYMIVIFIIKADNKVQDEPIKEPEYEEYQEEILEKSTTLLNISYETQDVFKQTINENSLKYFVYTNNEGGCYITITHAPQETYMTALNYLSEITKLEEGFKKYAPQKIISEIYEWDRMYLENDEAKKDFYAINYREHIYEISFNSVSPNKDICEPYKKQIIDSVKFN